MKSDDGVVPLGAAGVQLGYAASDRIPAINGAKTIAAFSKGSVGGVWRQLVIAPSEVEGGNLIF